MNELYNSTHKPLADAEFFFFCTTSRIHQNTVFIENPPKSHRKPPCSRVITEAGTDRRFKIDGEVVNFYVHYEIDDDTSRHVLTCEAYGGDGDGSWVLLEALV